ncbi:MAG TPA: LmeA family phospholipid-binding protein [Solirubrobacteraceae bacterium]|nr:LmeA family phospholipid-binding protein [Solirubrobacteraceae bacterium]
MRRTRKSTRVVLAVAVPVVLVALAQIVLPPLAARIARDRMKAYGDIRSVSVSAWPAVELLWGKADSATALASNLNLTTAQMTKLAWEARGIHDLDLSVDTLDLKVPGVPNDVLLRNVRTQKRGSSMQVSATLTQSDLAASVPSGFTVQPVASGGGQVEVHATGGLFGLQASIDALVRPLDGRLIAEPHGLPLSGIATVTLFSDPHLKVEWVGLTVTRRQPLAYGLTLRASLR